MKSELVAALTTRQAQRDALAAYFRSRPDQVLTHEELKALVGENLRSRISDCRDDLGMVIENVPVFKADGKTRGYGSYRFRPESLGREADTFVAGNPDHGTLFDAWPSGWQR